MSFRFFYTHIFSELPLSVLQNVNYYIFSEQQMILFLSKGKLVVTVVCSYGKDKKCGAYIIPHEKNMKFIPMDRYFIDNVVDEIGDVIKNELDIRG